MKEKRKEQKERSAETDGSVDRAQENDQAKNGRDHQSKDNWEENARLRREHAERILGYPDGPGGGYTGL